MGFLARGAIGFAAFLWLASSAICEEIANPTARGVFSELPPTIFENTPGGLDETGKQALLQTGSSQYWEIEGETPDILVITELPFKERAVAVRLFRNYLDGSVEIVVGTLGDPVCSLEIWRLDASGRLVPVEAPQEPEIGEFFKRKPRKGQQSSVRICLGLGGLWAKPVFWNQYGVVEPEVDNEISYQWNGSEFRKVTVARRKAASKN